LQQHHLIIIHWFQNIHGSKNFIIINYYIIKYNFIIRKINITSLRIGGITIDNVNAAILDSGTTFISSSSNVINMIL